MKKKLLYLACGILVLLSLLVWRLRGDYVWSLFLFRVRQGRLMPPDPFAEHPVASLLAALFAVMACGLLWLVADGPVGRRLRRGRGGAVLRFLQVGKVTLAALLVFTVLVIVSVRGASASIEDSFESVMRTRELIADSKWIIHAGGMLHDEAGNAYTYTNSREALQQCLDAGVKVIELDIRPTSDGKLVCIHNWEDLTDESGQPVTETLSLEAFKRCRVFGQFTPMTMDDVSEALGTHEDICIVADTRGGRVKTYKKLSRQYPDLKDRFIAQIYHMDQFETVYGLGFHKVIFTLYKTEPQEREAQALQRAADEKLLLGFTVRESFLEQEGFLEDLLATGTPVYIHTVDEPDRQAQLFDAGVEAIYTNVIL